MAYIWVPCCSSKNYQKYPPEVPPADCHNFALGKATTSAISYFEETNSRMIVKYIKNIKIGKVIIQPSVFCLSKFSVGRNEVSFWSS